MDWIYWLCLWYLQVLLSLVGIGNLSQLVVVFVIMQLVLLKWLKELEEDVGLLLFEWYVCGLWLMFYGEVLIEYVCCVEVQFDIVCDDMVVLCEGGSGFVMIGMLGVVVVDMVLFVVLQLLKCMLCVQVWFIESMMNQLMLQFVCSEFDIVVGCLGLMFVDLLLYVEVLYVDLVVFVVWFDYVFVGVMLFGWDDVFVYLWIVWLVGMFVYNVLEVVLYVVGCVQLLYCVELNLLIFNFMLLNNIDLFGVVLYCVVWCFV